VRKLGANTYEVEDISSRRTAARWRMLHPRKPNESLFHQTRHGNGIIQPIKSGGIGLIASPLIGPIIRRGSIVIGRGFIIRRAFIIKEESSSSRLPSVSSATGSSSSRSYSPSDSSLLASSFPPLDEAFPALERPLDNFQSPSAPGRSASEVSECQTFQFFAAKWLHMQ